MVFVRTAAARDLAEISSLLVATWRATYDPIYGPEKVGEITSKWHSVDALKGHLDKPNSEFIVAEDGSEVQGMAFASADPSGESVFLHQLYVRPDRHRRGIGAMLLTEVIECFPEARKIRLEVISTNHNSIAFYRANGFSQAGEADFQALDGFSIPVTVYEWLLP